MFQKTLTAIWLWGGKSLLIITEMFHAAPTASKYVVVFPCLSYLYQIVVKVYVIVNEARSRAINKIELQRSDANFPKVESATKSRRQNRGMDLGAVMQTDLDKPVERDGILHSSHGLAAVDSDFLSCSHEGNIRSVSASVDGDEVNNHLLTAFEVTFFDHNSIMNVI